MTRNIFLFFLLFLIVVVKGTTAQEDSNSVDYDALVSLLTAGENYHKEEESTVSVNPSSLLLNSLKPSNFLGPQLEVLKIIEQCIRLKGEVTSRLYALASDNFDLVQSIFQLFVGKLSKLHRFSIKGIQVFRQILEFTLNILSGWQVPS